MCGASQPVRGNEAGVVSALVLAVLQELNGRNVDNPIACIEREKPYQRSGFNVGLAKPRYLNADVMLDQKRIGLGTKRLASLGWRYFNWVEAKFFRDGKQSKPGGKYANGTTHAGLLAADLVRLATLVPEVPGRRTLNGRYLLHVYDDDPALYLSDQKSETKTSPGRFTRNWLKDIRAFGQQTLKDFRFADEVDSFRAASGALGDLQLTLQVTNSAFFPRSVPTGLSPLWFVLTRIDAVEATIPGRAYRVNLDRGVEEEAVGDYAAIRDYVAARVGLKEEQEPEPGPDDVMDEEVPPEVADEIGVSTQPAQPVAAAPGEQPEDEAETD
jgi:hypothetical protein